MCIFGIPLPMLPPLPCFMLPLPPPLPIFQLPFMHQRPAFSPPAVEYRPLPAIALPPVATADDINNTKPEPEQEYNGVYDSSNSNGEYDIDGNLISDGEETILVNNNSEVTEEKYHGGPAPTDGSVPWVEVHGGQVPADAVIGGHNCSGEPVFVARAMHQDAILPGMLVPVDRCAFVPWGGHGHSKSHYQILIGNFTRWMSTHGSDVPSGALVGGQTKYGEPLYIGRIHHEGSVIIGKVQKSHSVCYIPLGGKEVAFPDYEVLMNC